VKLFITGGNGFLGKHILAELAKTNIQYYAPPSSKVNLLNDEELYDALRDYAPDSILHLAAMCGGLPKNSHLPADFLRENTQMALNIYECARQNNITQIYAIGSVCMYPINCPIPFHEDTIFDGPAEPTNFPYGQAKRTLMMLGQSYRKQYNFSGAFLIPVNMFGPKDCFDDDKSHVIPAIIKKIDQAMQHNHSTVELIGSGNATREFLFSQDSAEAIVKAITINLDTNLPINLGTGKSISIRDLANLISQLMEYQGQIVFKDDGMDGQPKRELCVKRAEEMLGWTAQTSLKNGLIQTIKWWHQYKPIIP